MKPKFYYDIYDGVCKYSAFNAALFAWMSGIVYGDVDEIIEDVNVSAGSIGFFRIIPISVDNMFACILESNDFVVIAIRGTEPNSFNDWISDLRATPISTYLNNNISTEMSGSYFVHKGFYIGATALLPYINANLANINSDRPEPKKVYVCGHSLGGAVATILGSFLDPKYKPKIYTYGAPKVGSKSFASNYSANIVRFVNSNDIVPKLPHFYSHPKNCSEYFLNRNGDLIVDPKFGYRYYDLVLSRFFNFRWFGTIRDHYITNYTEKLFNLRSS